LIVKKLKSLRDCFRIKDKTGKERKTVSETREKKQDFPEKKPPQHTRPGKEKATDLGRKKDRLGKRDQVKKDHLRPSKKVRTKVSWKLSDFDIPPVKGHTRFHDLELPDPVMHAIADLGFKYCTPIQAEILPSTLRGKDATGRAQTGTGKTAAFLITAITWMLHHPTRGKRKKGTPRVLIIAPTRELALQIEAEARELSKYCPFTMMSVFGGMDYERQKRKLREKVIDIIVATPGRLLDYHRSHDVHLDKVEILVIDEADRMLDMGFIPDVRRIIHTTPPKTARQTLLFSATLTSEVTRLASQWTRKPVVVEIEPEHVAVDTVDQIVYIVTIKEKYALLYNVIAKQNLERVLVFCNRRDQTRRLADMLRQYGMNCEFLSGEVPQKKRIRILENFKTGKIRVLVATDVAGRGIHVEGISHVINYTLPHDPEDYVHRIGRTGRAGVTGTSVSFACEEDSFFLPDIEKFTGKKLHCITPDDDWLILPPKPRPKPKKRRDPRPQKVGPRHGRRGRNPRRNKGVKRQRGSGKN
jgi:ATP-dependent RNA helicase RhlB